MKKTVIKGIAFVVIFVISLVVISMVANQGNGDMTAPMSTACLPTMAIVEDGQEINQMYGYTMQMDTADMRESITPIKTARQINAVVHGYGTEIAGVSYELLRAAGRSDNPVINLISKPGLWMQGLTTKEPDDRNDRGWHRIG